MYLLLFYNTFYLIFSVTLIVSPVIITHMSNDPNIGEDGVKQSTHHEGSAERMDSSSDKSDAESDNDENVSDRDKGKSEWHPCCGM